MRPWPSVRIWNEASGYPVLHLTWRGAKRSFSLQIFHMDDAGDYSQIVGPGALEEAQVSGQPVAVVRGAWNADTQEYDLIGLISLTWKYDETTVYSLDAFEPNIPLSELIRIAESIP